MRFAITIPFYNEETRIIDTLESFLYQPVARYLVFILINNNSTDRSQQKIEEFAQKHPNIKIIIESEKSQGVIYARKKALDLAVEIKPTTIIGTDADTIFNKDILEELLDFSTSKKFDVFAGRGTIDAKTRLERLIFFPEFVKLSKHLWKKEFELFGPYFFGACFALKSSFYKKISPYFDIEESLIIKDGGGEDLLLARRAYYIGGEFVRSKSKVLTSPRRYLSDPLSWLTAKRSNIRTQKGSLTKQFIEYVNNNKVNILKNRLKNTLDRWIRSALDAYIFYLSTDKKYDRAMTATENFCKFFNIPSSEIPKSIENPNKVYRQLTKTYRPKAEKMLMNFVKQKFKF